MTIDQYSGSIQDMRKKLLLLTLWFPIACLLLTVNIIVLSERHNLLAQNSSRPLAHHLSPLVAVSQGSSQILDITVVPGDARALLLQKFLEKYGAPLSSYANSFVENADRYSIDYRLLASISMCESLGGKHVPEKDGYNPFGIAVYTGQNFGKKFTTWDHAIEWASKYIKDRYIDQGLTDLIQIGARWAPPSVEKGNSWANCVQSFMNQIL